MDTGSGMILVITWDRNCKHDKHPNPSISHLVIL
jgi:hypothetical protein